MPCVAHRDACECRMEIVRELVKELDYWCGICPGCYGWGFVPGHDGREPCVDCQDSRELLWRVREVGIGK